MRVTQIEGVGDLPGLHRESFIRRGETLGPAEARGLQFLSFLYVPDGFVAVIEGCEAAPCGWFVPGAFGFYAADPGWWQEGGPWPLGAAPPYWAWSVWAEHGDKTASADSRAGDIINIPPAIDPDDFIAGFAFPLIPWQTVPAQIASPNPSPLKITIEGPRNVVLLCKWDQRARLLVNSPYRIAHSEGSMTARVIPRATITKDKLSASGG